MVKKIFVGVLLAGVFGLLVLGAVNRTLAKSGDGEPLSLSEEQGSNRNNSTREREPLSLNLSQGGGNGNNATGNNGNQNGGSNDCLTDGESNGAGRGSVGGNTGSSFSGVGNRGNNSAGSAGSGLGGQNDSAAGNGEGIGLADVETWEDPIAVTVDSVASDLWIVSNDEGFELEIEGRTLSFMLDYGFQAQVGDELVLTGFYEDGQFEIGNIFNNRTQQTLAIRETSGRPLWAGGGQGAGLP
jgi:hypothetical protein